LEDGGRRGRDGDEEEAGRTNSIVSPTSPIYALALNIIKIQFNFPSALHGCWGGERSRRLMAHPSAPSSRTVPCSLFMMAGFERVHATAMNAHPEEALHDYCFYKQS